ncbi:MAG: hypothetical protein K8I82_31175 [Anaerolineae bacterium]|nr:hypothetical protein [Anaerolineae bacterium]
MCFGAVRHDNETVLSFSTEHPNSLQMWLFTIGLLAVARAEDKQVLVIIWDNASWHIGVVICRWIRAYNRANRLRPPICYLSKASDSTQLNSTGFMPNGMFVNRTLI